MVWMQYQHTFYMMRIVRTKRLDEDNDSVMQIHNGVELYQDLPQSIGEMRMVPADEGGDSSNVPRVPDTSGDRDEDLPRWTGCRGARSNCR